MLLDYFYYNENVIKERYEEGAEGMVEAEQGAENKRDMYVVTKPGYSYDVISGEKVCFYSLEWISKWPNILRFGKSTITAYDVNTKETSKIFDFKKTLTPFIRSYRHYSNNPIPIFCSDLNGEVLLYWHTDVENLSVLWNYNNGKADIAEGRFCKHSEKHYDFIDESDLFRYAKDEEARDNNEYTLLINNGFTYYNSDQGTVGRGFKLSVSDFNELLNVRIDVTALPKANETLYARFPGLKKYQGQEGLIINIYIDKCESLDEAFKLFIEEGREINFEGITVPADESTDGKEHAITNFGDYRKWSK